MLKVFIQVVFLTLPFLTLSQETRFPIRNFGPKDYGTSHNSENWSIVQDKQGMIVTANYGGILRFDGNNWQFTEIKKDSWISSIAVSEKGTVFAGSFAEFGMLNPDVNGRLKYISLSALLPEKEKAFSIIWKIFCIGQNTIFQAEEGIFIYDGKKIQTLLPDSSFHLSFTVGNDFFVRERGIGILKLSGNKLEKVDESNEFRNIGVFGILSGTKKDSCFIITQENGIFSGSISDHFKTIRKLKLPDENFLIQAGINGAILLNDNNIALTTKTSGLIITDLNGNILYRINKNTGLRDNEIKSICLDNRGRIWLALNNGISCIDYPSLLSSYSYEEGISGNVNAVLRFNNNLFVGTSDGLFRNNTGDNNKLFVQMKEVNGQVKCMKSFDNKLYIGTEESLYSFNGRQYKKEAANIRVFSMCIDTLHNILYCIGNKGIKSFKTGDNLIPLKQFPQESQFIASAINPINNVLWAGTQNEGAAKYTGDSINFYTAENGDGLPSGWVIPTTYNNKLLFQTNKGLYHFIEEDSIKATLPENLQNDPLNYRGYFEPYVFDNIPANVPVYAFAQSDNGFYFSLDNMITHFNLKNSTLFNIPFLGVNMGKTNTIFVEKNIVWTGFDDGLLRFDEAKISNLRNPVSCVIRNVYIGDSLWYNGSGYHTNTDSCLFSQPDNLIPEFSFNHNSLTFDFSSDYLDKCDYSYRLLPRDTVWSEWSEYPHATFGYIYEGTYTLEVKARTIYGAKSEITKWKFKILAPWYRSWWAYILYIAAGIILLIVIVRLNSRRLRQQNIRLEKIIEERTTEIREKNKILQVQKDEIEVQRDELGKQNIEIRHQKKEITDSIEYAKRIQTAAIPELENTSDFLKDFFVLYKPKDIVSGDFYWIGTLENKPIVIAADCTGHGVPGAFMSMLGIAFLNEIINKEKIGSPSEILNRLRHNIIKSLKQNSDEGGKTKDGMDITIVSIDYGKNILTFAGANNSVYFLRNIPSESPNVTDNLTELKPDKMPVAIYSIMEPFKETTIPFKKGDLLYLFSDGYADQFGGPKGRKFMSKHMKELFVEVSHLPVEDQKEIIEKAFTDWKKGYEQIDDVLVIGVKL